MWKASRIIYKRRDSSQDLIRNSWHSCQNMEGKFSASVRQGCSPKVEGAFFTLHPCLVPKLLPAVHINALCLVLCPIQYSGTFLSQFESCMLLNLGRFLLPLCQSLGLLARSSASGQIRWNHKTCCCQTASRPLSPAVEFLSGALGTCQTEHSP